VQPGCGLRLACGLSGQQRDPSTSCLQALVNRYLPGTPLSLHQDRDEQDLRQPIVSISLGLPAMFLFGGLSRSERPARWPLQHGDVLVWGGPSRLAFHGVQALEPGRHPLLGEQRINLTLRCAG